MNIRTMQISDYDRVYALWLSCPGMELNSLDDSREGIERFLNKNPDTCFVAEDGDAIIGVILAGNDGRRGYIYHTAVSPCCRNQGIGSRLVDAAVSVLKQYGITKVGLLVFEDNLSGNAYWEKRGFPARSDLVYRSRVLAEMVRIDT